MQHLTIIIPTKNRLEKLYRCLNSIPREPWITVMVACDGNPDASEALEVSRISPRCDMVVWCRQDMGVVARGNLVIPMVQDGLMGLADDVEFLPGTLEKAREIFNREFPDDDGVLGWHQEGLPGYCPTAICMIGQKFLCRYPGKQPMFPGYYHFCSDTEIYHLANKLGKFRFAGKDIAVFHHQGGYEGRPFDQTHHDSRVKQRDDAALYEQRQKAGLIWGFKNGDSED